MLAALFLTQKTMTAHQPEGDWMVWVTTKCYKVWVTTKCNETDPIISGRVCSYNVAGGFYAVYYLATESAM